MYFSDNFPFVNVSWNKATVGDKKIANNEEIFLNKGNIIYSVNHNEPNTTELRESLMLNSYGPFMFLKVCFLFVL